jgi:hypothetical protein
MELYEILRKNKTKTKEINTKKSPTLSSLLQKGESRKPLNFVDIADLKSQKMAKSSSYMSLLKNNVSKQDSQRSLSNLMKEQTTKRQNNTRYLNSSGIILDGEKIPPKNIQKLIQLNPMK